MTSLYFHPDHSGIALYASEFAEYAASQGHEVNVVTGFSFYPHWKKRKNDCRKLIRKDKWDQVSIYRGYLYVPGRPSTIKRMIQEVTFLLSSVIGFIRAPKPDVIVAFTTPVSLGFLSALFAKIYRAKLVVNVQDFQVEAARSLDMVGGSSWILKIFEMLERISYQVADKVSSISDGMLEILSKDKKLALDKVMFWPNWIDVSNFQSHVNLQKFDRAKHGIDESGKVVAYAGNIGLKQGLQVFVDVAKSFESNSEMTFLIVGEGADLQNLQDYSEQLHSTNLKFIPFLDQTEYQSFLQDLDVFFISQKKVEKDIYFPSKLLGLMAMSKAIVLSADPDSELYKVLSENRLAAVSPYGDVDQIAESIALLLEQASEKEKLESAAREFVNRYDKPVVLDGVLKKIELLK